jgi:glycosyltransferase involved in cell wall biosynthesis
MPDGRLDVVIPVYNEGENIVPAVRTLVEWVRTPFRILICYDRDDDNTLTALEAAGDLGVAIVYVKNTGVGAHGAVLSGFRTSTAEAVVVFPADDVLNARIVDPMFELIQDGCEIVAASRFVAGGGMYHCPWLKDTLVRLAAWSLYHLAGLPTHDASNGFRMFSRRCIRELPIESTAGFTYSLELLVRAHRRGWRVGEVPAIWVERKAGTSRFRVLRWLPAYLRWYGYAFATTWLRRGRWPRTRPGR